MASFVYDGTNAAHNAFVRNVERRMDEVAGDGETPRIQAAKVYEFGVESILALLRTAPRLLLAPLAVDLANLGAVEGLEIDDPADAEAPAIGVRYAFGTVKPRFLRFVRAKLEGWPRAVESADPTGTVAHAREHDPFTRPPAWRPRVYMRPGNGAFELELYPGPSVTFDELLILRETAPEAAVAAAPELADAIYWDTASRTLAAERYVDQAKAAQEMGAATISAQQVGLSGEADVTPNPSLA